MLYSKMLIKFIMPILALSLLAACGNESEKNETGRFEFSSASYSVNESGGMVEVTINRVGGSDGAATIDWRTQDNTATSIHDFGSVIQTSLSFADGETSRTETITIVNDDAVESDETFNILLSNPTGGASMGTVASTVVTIVNDDSDPVPQPGRFEFGAVSYSVSESGGMVEVIINRVGGSDGAVTIDWQTQDDTAMSTQDFGSVTQTPLTFADGETSRTETITIVNDDVVENDETFNVLLSNPTGGASMGTVASTAVTIINDDSDPIPQPGRFEFSSASYSISENGGVVEIIINRIGGNDGVVSVDWMTQGVTATFAQDYGDFNWTPLSFADGETSRIETITIVNDDVVEGDETFNVLLGNPTGGASMGTLTTTTVTITNDDSDPLPSLSIVSTTPLSQAYGIQLSSNITIEFSSNVDCPNVSSQTISLIDNNSDLPTTLTCIGSTLTINPVENFSQSTTYTVIVSSGIESDSGTSMVDDYSWTFTTLAGSALPLLEEWESKMLTDGEHWGQYITNLYPAPGTYNEQNMTYYDGQRVFYQIADYTGQQEPWNTYALEAKRVYLNYAENSVNSSRGYNFSFPGYRRFAQGIYMDYVRTGDASVYENIAKIRDNPAISEAGSRSISIPAWYRERRSREVAYALEAHIFAERAGYPRDEADVARYVTMALTHIKEWVTGEFGYPEFYRRAPFMFALTAEALIIFYEWELENGRDPTALYNHASVPTEFIPTMMIPEAIKSMADYLYDDAVVISGDNIGKPMWVTDIGGRRPNWNDEGGTGYSTFRYEDIRGGAPTVDLNLMIAPAYAWLFQHYSEMKYINIADKLFASGVSLSNTRWNTKIFNQNYRWSFDYIKWRNEGFAKIEGGGG